MSNGEKFAAEIRKTLSIGPRTRWARRTDRLSRTAIVERVTTSINYPGYDSEERTEAFRAGHAAMAAYNKHVAGYRIDGVLRFKIMDLSPWGFTAFLGEMIDSGCTNVGEFEAWFSAKSRG
jgi:hypothetical protein